MGWVKQLGEASCLASAGRVTLAGKTTFLHVNGWLAHPGRDNRARAYLTVMRFGFALQTNSLRFNVA